MSKDAIWAIAFSVAMALAGASLKWTFDANARIILLEDRLARAQQENPKAEIEKELRMLWKYSQWSHHQIDVLRNKAGLDVAEQPQFE